MDACTLSAANACPVEIIYGTAWKKASTAQLVSLAIRRGFRGIDTACQPEHYDEAGVGAGVAACLNGEITRADLYLQSKFTPVSSQDPLTIPYDRDAPLSEQVAQSFAASLRNLRTQYLDGFILHSPLANSNQTLEAWRAMESLIDRGIRRLGISNCYQLADLQALFKSAVIKPSLLQNRFYADTRYDREIRAFCTHHGITYQTFWTLSANPHLLAHATITGLASKYGRAPAQILFRYLAQTGCVPLTGTKSESHMREDLAICEFKLASLELEAIDSLL